MSKLQPIHSPFGLVHGSAYVVGKTNGDHWYGYLWEETLLSLPDFLLSQPIEQDKDLTLEILMCEMEAEVSEMFLKCKAYDKNGIVKAVMLASPVTNNRI